uniref:EGF-like domain-containing protein n=1 Tax=Trichobilharzia regenti TaxID=157069 RepID=A0AA85KLV9_TRIRE|nr:unnamed protein product [Trichobilharzia regenti]
MNYHLVRLTLKMLLICITVCADYTPSQDVDPLDNGDDDDDDVNICPLKKCQRGLCNQMKCVCEKCWKGEYCDISVIENIRFSKKVFEFHVLRNVTETPNEILGHLTLNGKTIDEVNECGGQIYFVLEEKTDSIFSPFYVENSTGFIRSNGLKNYWINHSSSNLSINVKVFITPDKEMDTSQVIVFWNSSPSTVYKRSANPVGNDLRITTSYSKTTAWCIGEFIILTVQLGLPSGTTSISVKMSAPTYNSAFYGFTEFTGISNIGARILNRNFTINVMNVTGNSIYDRKTVATTVSLSDLMVDDIPNYTEDYTLTLQFIVGLWPNSSTIQGKLITTQCDVYRDNLTQTNVTTNTVGSACPVSSPDITILSNIAYIVPGDIVLFEAEVLLVSEMGNYMFSVYTIGQSATISNFNITLKNGMSYTQGPGTRQYKDGVLKKCVLAKQIDIDVIGLKSLYAMALSLPKSDRSVRLVAYIQTTSFASTRAILGFRMRHSVTSVLFQEIQVPIIADYRNFKTVLQPSMDLSMQPNVVEVEKFAEIQVAINIPPTSKQLYAFEVSLTRAILGEICYASVVEVGSGITTRIPGMRLHVEYEMQKLTILRTLATVHIGVLENPTNSSQDYYIVFKIVVKARSDPAYPTVTETQMDTRYLIMGSSQRQDSIIFSIINTAIPPITAVDSPQINIYRSEPPQTEPMDTYQAIVNAEISWSEQVIYSPIKFSFSITGSSSTVLEQKFISIGRSLVTLVPINANMSIVNNIAVIEFPSIYVDSTSNNYDAKLTLWYAIRIVGTAKFSAKLDVSIGVYLVSGQVTFSPIAASAPPQLTSSQVPYWTLESLATSRSNTSVIRGDSTYSLSV